jgi:hypothetical protein
MEHFHAQIDDGMAAWPPCWGHFNQNRLFEPLNGALRSYKMVVIYNRTVLGVLLFSWLIVVWV